MNQDKLEIAGNEIETKLIEIRERMGASLRPFSIKQVDIQISGEKLQELANENPNKPIIIGGEFHLAYIKDHVNTRYHGNKEEHDKQTKLHPSGCFMKGNKVHFYNCETLIKMNSAGKQKKYRATSKISNTRNIDLKDAPNLPTRLAWCKYCINILFTNSQISEWKNTDNKSKIAECGDAKILMDCIKAYYYNDTSAEQKVQYFYKSIMRREQNLATQEIRGGSDKMVKDK